jgi:hypothetical protein
MHTTTTLLTALTSATLALANPAPAPHPALVTPAPAIHPAAAQLAARQFRTSDSDLSKSVECASLYGSLAQGMPRETNRDLGRWLLTAAGSLADLATATAIDESFTTLCDASVTATLTPPASLSSAYSTYLDNASSWVTSIAPAASSIAESCGGQISAFIDVLVISDSESCTKAVLGLVDVYNGDDVTTTGSGSATVSPTGSRTTAAPEESETGSAGGDDGDDDNNDGGDDSGSGNGDSDDNDSDETGPAGAAETSSTSTGGVPRETGFVGVAAAAAVAVVGVVAAL